MAKDEITFKYAKKYSRASKKTKGEILDIVVEVTGWSRDNARRRLKKALQRKRSKYKRSVKRRTRPLKYSPRTRQILVNAWSLSGNCCGQYLFAQIKSGLLKRLIAHGELYDGHKNKGYPVSLSDPAITELYQMSSATIDRYLRKAKRELMPPVFSTTRQASYPLHNEVPFGKSYEKHKQPGWLSTDTVAHCGSTLKGDHLWTVNSTDTVTGWTETITIKNRASCHVRQGHEDILPRFPFTILGINYDSGSEFINREMIDYAKLQNYQMTRSRPYHSNDNAHVEQKNYEIIRKHAFRYRYDGEEAMEVLNELWFWVNLRKNYLVPTRKCIGHSKTKSGRTRGIYDEPKTPAQRLLLYDCVSQKNKNKLMYTMQNTNDAVVTRNIINLQDKLLRLAIEPSLVDYVKQEILAAGF